MADAAVLREALRAIRLFEGVSDEDLAWLERAVTPVEVAVGQRLLAEGEPGDELFLIVEGRLEATRHAGRDEVVVGTIAPGDVIGEMAVLDGGTRTATVVATTPARLLRLSRADFARFLADRPSASLEILRMALRRLQNTEATLQQREKMAALGTLAAGLTHELNNPAAAAQRAADQLGGLLGAWQEAARELGGLALTGEAAATVDALAAELEPPTDPSGGSGAPAVDPLGLADAAEELEEALAAAGLTEPWELAPILARCGWSRERLERVAGSVGSARVPIVVRWFAAGAAIRDLLMELGMAVTRISELVGAVKSYAHLDRAPVQEVDVTTGLESTLVILRHKLRDVEVVRSYAPDLPRVEAFAGELNQVWTNLIDNAVDAMGGRGRLELRAAGGPERVQVDVCDDGPGIVPELRERIFEPFFTTKPVGVGSGLGLHIAYGIVVREHGGDLSVESRPGRTCFHVTLPLRLPPSAGAPGGAVPGDPGRSEVPAARP